MGCKGRFLGMEKTGCTTGERIFLKVRVGDEIKEKAAKELSPHVTVAMSLQYPGSEGHESEGHGEDFQAELQLWQSHLDVWSSYPNFRTGTEIPRSSNTTTKKELRVGNVTNKAA